MALAGNNLESAGSQLLNSEPTGKVFTARAFIDSARYRELDRKQQYFDCTQHNSRAFDFDGRVLMANTTELSFTQPTLSSEKASWYVPLRMRRPSAPYRLTRAIVNAFTNFVFGEGRFPQIRVPGDEDSQDFVQTSAKVGHLPLKMIETRNLGGAVGTVGMSWSFVEGRPRFRAHNGKNLYVHDWEDREALIPGHVTECYQVTNEEWDPRKKAVVKVPYWYRRDWTSNSEIVFKLVRVEPDEEPDWEAAVDVKRSVAHGDRDPHFVWIQNRPTQDIDGSPDCEGQFESLDEIDTLLSVVVRGAKLNLDPTLVIKEDKLFVQRMGIKKGSDNALVVDKDGDAKYLELAGSSIKAGIDLFNEFRKTILEAVECVIPDPDQIAAQGQSAAAQKMVFSRMISKGGVIQEQYGTGIERLLEPLLFVAQARVAMPVSMFDESGKEVQVNQSFDLPTRYEPAPVMGDDGQPTGEQRQVPHERHPGEGEGVELEWPPRFPPTPLDQQQVVGTATAAAGVGVPVMSQQTAVEIVMGAFNRDANQEWSRVQADAKKQKQEQDQAMQDSQQAAGGAVQSQHSMPPGAKPKPGGGAGGKGPPAPGKSPDEEPPAEPPAD